MDKSVYSPLKQYLDAVGICCARFARLSGIRVATIYDVYHGRTKPHLSTVKKICRYTEGKLRIEDFGYGS